MYAMIPVTVLYLPQFSLVHLATLVYIGAAYWTWKHPGVKTGDTLMVLFYGLTTVNHPLLGLNSLLYASGSYILVLNYLDFETAAFAPVFASAYFATQLVPLLPG